MPDICKIAIAYGFKTLLISNLAELNDKIKETLNFDGPVLCDVNIDSDPDLKPRVASQLTPEGRIISSPLEDMYPLLDRKEFMEHMFIKPL